MCYSPSLSLWAESHIGRGPQARIHSVNLDLIVPGIFTIRGYRDAYYITAIHSSTFSSFCGKSNANFYENLNFYIYV